MSTFEVDENTKKREKSSFFGEIIPIQAKGDTKLWRKLRKDFIGFAPLSFGNRCGNTNQLIFVDTTSKKTPQFLKSVIKRVRQYYKNPDLLPMLKHVGNKLSTRQQRSERRNSCINVLCFLLSYMDIPSMRVGYFQAPGIYDAFTVHYIARALNFSESRVHRAMKNLEKAGLIDIYHRNEEKETNVYRGLSAVKRFTPSLFAALGLTKQLESAKPFFTEKHRKEKFARDTAMLSGIFNRANTKNKTKKKPRQKSLTEQENREILVLIEGVTDPREAARIKATYKKERGFDP